MPQIMTGRYYQQSNLRDFRSDSHPREYPFAVRDPDEAQLPRLMRDAGYETIGVSAHPWVSPESHLGAAFERLELLDSPVERGHADARAVVDRGLQHWDARDRTRPLFLYLHFMDPHIPRTLPDGRLRFTEGVDQSAAARFDAAGEPAFDSKRRGWDRSDASDFSAADRAYFTAVYDTLLAYLDEQIGVLLARLEADDPGFARTLVMVGADHGEELGEHGRIGHEDSLADGVQQVPWIIAGAGVEAGRVVRGVTENVDVLPTLATLMDLPVANARFDGRAQLRGDGGVCADCQRHTATFAWEDYRALRSGRLLLREPLPASLTARCRGARQLLAGDRRQSVAHDDKRRRMAWHLADRLDAPEHAYRRGRYAVPADRPFDVPASFWRLATGDVGCLAVGVDTPSSAFGQPGWLWTGRGLALLAAPLSRPVTIEVDAPDGMYEVEAGIVPVAPQPWFFGFERWRRKSFRDPAPVSYVPVGRATAHAGTVRLEIPPEVGLGRHLVSVRLTPPGSSHVGGAEPDPALEERLRRLGYVE